MAANNGNGTDFFWDRVIPTIYSVGAAVVILGALFKITHRAGANEMLTIGLGTEAVIFVLYAIQSFLRPPREYQWEKVYPELEGNFAGASSTSKTVGVKMDNMFANAQFSPEFFGNMERGMTGLNTAVMKMADLSDATVATKEYATNLRAAANNAGELNQSYSQASAALKSIADVSKDTQEYRASYQKATQNLASLNGIYELELQDTKKHLGAIKSFYGNVGTAMQDMQDVSRDTQQFKSEMNKLNGNLASLNNLYGSMLSAMKGN